MKTFSSKHVTRSGRAGVRPAPTTLTTRARKNSSIAIRCPHSTIPLQAAAPFPAGEEELPLEMLAEGPLVQHACESIQGRRLVELLLELLLELVGVAELEDGRRADLDPIAVFQEMLFDLLAVDEDAVGAAVVGPLQAQANRVGR